jgi:hypothetical protein
MQTSMSQDDRTQPRPDPAADDDPPVPDEPAVKHEEDQPGA